MDAACILKKMRERRGNENQAYFHESKGEETRGKERLSYLSTYLQTVH